MDVIAITDHIEYQPHKEDVSTNHNRSYEIARPAGAALDVLVVRGSEITRKMPPGHLNAVFLTNSALLVLSNWHDAVVEAHRQGAFIFWNHPGWDAQLIEGRVQWFPEHTQILEEGLVHGIEDLSTTNLRINGGFFVMRPEVFDYMRPGEELVEEPFRRLIARGKLLAEPYDGFWTAMDTFKDKQQLDEQYAAGSPPWEVPVAPRRELVGV